MDARAVETQKRAVIDARPVWVARRAVRARLVALVAHLLPAPDLLLFFLVLWRLVHSGVQGLQLIGRELPGDFSEAIRIESEVLRSEIIRIGPPIILIIRIGYLVVFLFALL